MTNNLPESKNLSKKDRIIELISDGSYSPKDVARMVGTSVANVWKEKSNLKKSGFLVRQKVERSDKTVLFASADQDIYASNNIQRKGIRREYQELIDIPRIDSEGMKKLYSDLNEGKKPGEIIATRGFHPEVVEKEYLRTAKLDPYTLLRRIVDEVIVFRLRYKGNELVRKYSNEGQLSEDEVIELLKEHSDAARDSGIGSTHFSALR